MAFQANAFQVSGNKAFQSGGAVVVTPPATDSGMVVGYSRSRLRKWIQELVEARARAKEAARNAGPAQKEALDTAALAAEHAWYAAVQAASDKHVEAKLVNQVRRAASLLNAAISADTVVAAMRSARYSRQLADELEEDEDMTYITRLLGGRADG